MDPITIAIVAAYFLVRRGGENVMWLARKDGTDPPSYRRWQERQKRRGARGSITGRTEGRKFWAHLWHDSWDSAHEWRQRRRGRTWEDRRKRWQAEDVEREKQRALAPCVFCGAGQGEDCRDDCPEVQAHAADRATGDRATEPTGPAVTEPSDGTAPSQKDTPEPAEPSHPDGTVRPATKPTEPEPSRPSGADRASSSRATEPNRAASETATEPADDPTPKPTNDDPDDPVRQFTEELLAAKEEQLRIARKAVAEHRDQFTPADIREHEENCARLEREIAELRFMLGPNRLNNVTPIDRNRSAASRRSMNDSTTGGNVTTPNVTGEIQGYEATLAEMDQTIAHLEAIHADADQKVHGFEGLDAVYENRINALRAANADEETIGTQVAAREANEIQISAAKAQLEAAAAHLEAETAARARWVAGIGAMKETADATGAEGDRVLRS